ncbi:hypothetical protein HZI73_21100 [Vallitalea pronyensis]|uniref:Uncharacterized protein n=1 Tax=Vallitalea pronyensis TaxID=1348613 RepID=A0A8J8MNV3_9FIRM|nr:hypothetical protein [Vallitalea pronyensis]QUI24648.1 hypothetical protein HZI73_21100 [Vallitalea pronyensis]
MCAGMLKIRFKQVLQESEALFSRVLMEENMATYVEDIYCMYEKLKNETHRFQNIYMVYLDFAQAIHAIYKYLKEHQVTEEDALIVLCELCIETTHMVLDRFSFIQLAYYYAVKKAYLKLIITHALTSLDSLQMAQELEEQVLDVELEKSMKACHIEEYFAYHHVEELIEIVYIMESSFDIFLDRVTSKDHEDRIIERII